MKNRLIALLLCVVLVPRGFSQNLPDLGDSASADLSPLAEQKIGAQIMRDIRWRDPAYLRDAEVEDYLNRTGERLVAASAGAGMSFEFFGVSDGSLNAFAMPGGKIGVHTGLILAAQSESELAGVLAHEVSHVTQRHIARLVGKQSQTGMVMLASLLVAVLAAKSSAQASQAAIMAGQAAGISSQLAYSRDFEHEADRIGLQTLSTAGYDVRGMAAFFERLQRNGRLYENNAPAYLRTHPLTGERISEMENRVMQMPYRQVPDSLDFQLVRAKLRVGERPSRELLDELELAVAQGKPSPVAARYGLVRAYLALKRLDDAQAALAQLKMEVRRYQVVSPMLAGLEADLHLARRDFPAAVRVMAEARGRFPQSRRLLYGLVSARIEAGQAGDALELAKAETLRTPADAYLWELRARAEAALGKRLPQHYSLGEVYAIQGNYAAAVEQLTLAQAARDGDFFEQSAVDSRLREVKVLLLEQVKERRESSR
ncbi:MAG: M48 family metalloprotease [Zoogloea sp.]|uniref:beta-barrel assembly-enhancing protease n=1 Tax=Zoogloea sp. TaxID=49181 RepID=UPI0026285572|nr:M48 family metalloprotease [Zoogloea sp.]MDD2991866.1 M48 family metalloprotease [Zoogloea sp.]